MEPGRLARGRSYARAHRRAAFGMKAGRITATIKGNISAYFGVHETPYYEVAIEFERIPAQRWKGILERLGTNADWVTHLILGEVPPTIEDALDGSKVKLLPRMREDLHASCSCPDFANPCKHVAGVYYHVAALLDRDPLLLFELRGMNRKKLMASLKKSQFGAALLEPGAESDPSLEAALREPRLPDVGAVAEHAAPDDLRAFWRGTPLPRAVTAERPPPPVPALLLRREGDYPEFWDRHNSFIEAMTEIYERVAKRFPARNLR